MRARKARNWSQAELGRELEAVEGRGRGWSRQSVHAAERGNRAFGVSDLIALAIVLERPVSWFLTPLPVKIVSERLGHASVSITYDTYTHAISGMGKEAADEVARLIFGTGS